MKNPDVFEKVIEYIQTEHMEKEVICKLIQRDTYLASVAIEAVIDIKDDLITHHKSSVADLAYSFSAVLDVLPKDDKMVLGRRIYNGIERLKKFFAGAPESNKYSLLLDEIEEQEPDLKRAMG